MLPDLNRRTAPRWIKQLIDDNNDHYKASPQAKSDIKHEYVAIISYRDTFYVIRAILGVYELGRFELLRDLFVWAYERSTLEYLVIKQDLTEPDTLRLSYCDVIKHTIHDIVMQPEYYYLGQDITFESVGITVSVQDIYQRVNNEDVVSYLRELQEKT